MPTRLVVLATHPVQYQSPFFQALAARREVDLRVLYAYRPTSAEQGVGFSTEFTWDLPLLDGYSWRELDEVRWRSPSPHGFLALSAPGLTKTLRAERAEVVLVMGWHSWVLVQGALAAHRLRLPAILRGESNDLRQRPLHVGLAHRLFFRRFTAFLAIGRANKRLYEAAGVPAQRIFDAPYAVDNDRFTRAAAELEPRRLELRRSWGFADEDYCVLFAGKLESKKRPLDLLGALELARSEGAKLSLLVAGAGDLEAAVRARAASLQLPVAFAGFLNQTEIPRAYAAADVLVLPSDAGETWGLVVNEAMASGVPAIVSDRVGCREDLIEDGVTGCWFPCGDIRALATCLTSLASDPARSSRLGEGARRRVLDRYSYRQTIEGTLEALESVRRWVRS